MYNPYLLHVDDDPDDRDFVRDVLSVVEPRLMVKAASNGREAVDYLRSPDAGANPPRLILLDLNMPVMTGEETLKVLKEDPRTAGLDVVVLTTSHSPKDKEKCRNLGIDLYTKPSSYEQLRALLVKIIERIKSDWT